MTSTSDTPKRSALILAFATIYLVWGSTYLAMRVAIETMPPLAMAAARFLIAGALLFSFLRWRGLPNPDARQWRIHGVTGALLMLGGNGAVVWAEQYVPSGITALIIGVQPLFFVLVEWAWPGGRRPTLITTLSLAVGFAGVAWLAAPWETAAGQGYHLGGVIAILGACVSWAVGSIYSRHAKHGTEPFMAAALQMLTGGAALALAALLRGDFGQVELAAISLRSWGAFAYLIVLGSLAGFSTFVWLMKHAKPAQVATYAYVNPLVAVFLGWLILDEAVGPRTLAASVLIIAAVVLVSWEKNRPHRPRSPA